MIAKQDTGLRKADPMPMAREQPAADFLFERGDLPADRGLGRIERLSGAAEAAQLGDTDEGVQQSEVHGAIILDSYPGDTKHSIYVAPRRLYLGDPAAASAR
jgi:hypothetical protein